MPHMSSNLRLLQWLAFAASIVLGGCRPDPPEVVPLAVEAAPEDGLRTTMDPGVVFRRAFWAHPAEDDEILSAELREWIDASTGTVSSWQWFIHLRPGAAMKNTLQPGGRFNLLSPESATVEVPDSAPHWFSPGGAATLRSSNGLFTVFTRQNDESVFAYDAGGGFAAPVNP